MTRDLLKKNFSELATDGALEICIIKVITIYISAKNVNAALQL
jgi:hypothetical protein|tara:strand:- start:207 stop:335 length:129 start_codon:yes stop_codon:yes gene_type:complete